MTRSFGKVRNSIPSVVDIAGTRQGLPGNYAGGYGNYAMASGITMTKLSEAEAKLTTLSQERAILNNKVGAAQQALDANQKAYTDAGIGWRSCASSDCKWNHSASRCNGCKNKWQALINTAETARPALASAMTTAKSNLSAKDAEISVVKDTIAGLLASIEAENQAEATLAGQGKTSEQINIEAEARATAFVEDAKAQAQVNLAKSDVSTSGKKMRNTIIALVVIAALVVGTIFMIRKIRKKRQAK
jgi:hypothetical protein